MNIDNLKKLTIPERFVVAIDSNEQLPLKFKLINGLYVPTERYKLPHGDYSIKGMEKEICFERKMMSDLISYIASYYDKKNYHKKSSTMWKLKAMKPLLFKELVIEEEDPFIQFPFTRKITPSHVHGFIKACKIKFQVHIFISHLRRDLEYEILSLLLYYWEKKQKGEI